MSAGVAVKVFIGLSRDGTKGVAALLTGWRCISQAARKVKRAISILSL
jgi:hypothetical protein